MANEIPANITIGAIDRISKTIDRVKARFPGLISKVNQTQSAFSILQKQTEGVRKSLEKVGEKMKGVGKSMSLGITAPVLAGAALSIKKFMDFEEALSEVRGSTGLTKSELKEFGDRISNITKKMPIAGDELLSIAAAAGEVGVRGVNDLEKFSLTMAQLGKTAGLKGEEAVASIAQIMKVTGEGVDKVDRFGSSITALGQTFGVPVKKIVEGAEAITKETARFGVSSHQAAALATAMKDLGFNSKQMGNATGDAFRGIDEAIRKGGIKMVGLTKITGMTGDQLRKQFKENPTEVFKAFLGGLAKIEKNGGVAGDALKFFGASGEKTETILLGLAKNSSLLNDTLKVGAEEYAKNTALSEEFAETTDTFASKLQLLQNNVGVLAKKIGAFLIPYVSKFVDVLMWGISFLEAHPFIAKMIAGFVALLAVLGPIIYAFGWFVGMIPTLITGWNALVAVILVFKGVATAIGVALGAISWPVIALIALLGILFALIVSNWDSIKDFFVNVWEWGTQKIMGFIEGVKGAIDVVKRFFGIGGEGVNGNLTTTNRNVLEASPQGAPLGAEQASRAMNSEFMSRTNNARVDINVRAPQSTSVRSESEGGFLAINRGIAGAF